MLAVADGYSRTSGHRQRGVGLDAPGAQAHGAVAERGQGQVMRDEHQRRAALAPQREDQVDDRAAGALVEIAGRLVGNEDGGSGATARAMATRCCSPPESWAG